MKTLRTCAVACIGLCVLMPATAHATGEEDAGPGYEVVQCLANPRPILGTAAIYRLLIANHTDGELFVSVPEIRDGVTSVTYPYYVDNCPVRGYRGIFTFDRVAPRSVGVWNYAVPMAYTSRVAHVGQRTVRVELRVAKGLLTIGDERHAFGTATVDSEPSEDVLVTRVAGETYKVYPRILEGGRIYAFGADYEIVEPAPRDRAFFEAYVEPSLALGTCWWSGESKWARDRDLHAAVTTKAMNIAAREPFTDELAKPWFKRFFDNGYYAFRRSLKGLSDQRDDIVGKKLTRLASPFGRTWDTVSPSVYVQEKAEAAKAEHFLYITPLAWDWYLDAATGAYLGTSQHRKAIEIIERVSKESPDCVTRYLARELLRRRAEMEKAQQGR